MIKENNTEIRCPICKGKIIKDAIEDYKEYEGKTYCNDCLLDLLLKEKKVNKLVDV